MPDSVRQFLLEVLSADGVAEQAKEILKAYKHKTSGERNSAETNNPALVTNDAAVPTTFLRPDLAGSTYRIDLER